MFTMSGKYAVTQCSGHLTDWNVACVSFQSSNPPKQWIYVSHIPK